MATEGFPCKLGLKNETLLNSHGMINAETEILRGSRSSIVHSEPNALDDFGKVLDSIRGKEVVVFLDYDGTLAPIVDNPDKAYMTDKMRKTVQTVASKFTTAIVTGRAKEKVKKFVNLAGIVYAGSHGFEIECPDNLELIYANDFLPMLKQVFSQLEDLVSTIEGATLENNVYSISVHYRCISIEKFDDVKRIVDNVAKRFPLLEIKSGKKVFEFRPRVKWGKGRAVKWLLTKFGLSNRADIIPIFIGDDVTDEDAFNYLLELPSEEEQNITKDRKTMATYSLRSTEEVRKFLDKLNASSVSRRV
eukprot:GSMAST32.ASY1.ANO1.1984.1 assembled CDS